MKRRIIQRELRNNVAELCPVRQRRFVPRVTIAATQSHAPGIDAERFRRDLDAVIVQGVNN